MTTEEMVENFTLDTASKNIFIISKKTELGMDIEVPLEVIESNTYKPGGFFEVIKNGYGYVFSIDTVDVYTVIPRFEIGGR